MAEVRAHRFMKDIADFTKHAIDGICLTDYDTIGMRFIEVSVVGPAESPYAGGTFDVRLNLPLDFPFQAPKVYMSTTIWHPNISSVGRVCVSVLSSWSPATTLLEVSEAIHGLLADPNPDLPLNMEAARMLDTDKAMYEAIAKMWMWMC
ncbi:uncharacterized protein LOC113215719 [Frankliniella occidentalis]|uniref:Uncharacterized protein LOC113215719 n=1 Tax=Frankliniella occidentalis TaxID=133901 RepID=A0A9C6XT27_FRAOC|nr:uncharacterized protein LOC113215719 [Frankliniella occidentalis]